MVQRSSDDLHRPGTARPGIGPRIAAGASGVGAKIREHGWWGLWAVLGLGLLLRIATLLFYGPVVYYYSGDATRYMRLSVSGVHGLFGDNAIPVGYPVFLALLRHVDSWLPLTILTQHLLGLVGAVLLYAAVRVVGAPRWAALLPVAVVALNGDEIFIEHGILTEALWMPLLALALYLLARSIRDPRPRRWLVAGGIALAGTVLVRSISEPLPIVAAIWAAVALPGMGSRRLKNAAAVLLPAIAVVGLYLVIAKPIAGGHSGLNEDSAALYGRVGQFADCSKFTPPPGTRVLCVNTPDSERAGPFYWTWNPASPLRSKFGFVNYFDGKKQQELKEFAVEAILHQPVEYAIAAGRDFVHFFVPWPVPRPESGIEERGMSFATVDPPYVETLATEYREAYTGVDRPVPSNGAKDIFGGYQSLFRVNGLLLLLMIVLGACGCFLGPAARRSAAALFLICGMVLLVVPPMFFTYDQRYALPSTNIFAAAAALGIAALVERFRRPLAEGSRESLAEAPEQVA